jgi:nitrogen fixation/metabolism regulation signal transduction histidine kinase
MAFRARFVAGLAWRAALFTAAAAALAASIATPNLGAARVVAAACCVWALVELWRYIQRTNLQLARFVDAVRFGDLSQGFAERKGGSGFREVGAALDEGMRRLREERHRLTDASRFYEAVLDDAPTPLLTVDAGGRVDLANKAARRLFARHQGVRVEDFRGYGEGFAALLAEEAIAQPRLVPLMIDGVPQTARVSSAGVHRLGGAVRVVAVQPIEGELNAVEIAAQSDLVRVLTHEIMNSMTPVTSLARTAADLMKTVDRGGDPATADARSAVETLARRADGVMQFVESYRQISRTPEIRARLVEVRAWARDIETLFQAGGDAEGVDLEVRVVPDTMTVDCDPELMFQVLINLLRNAAHAARSYAVKPAIRLSFGILPGGRAQIEVADNGPGVPEALRQDVFLPFFTTKAKGTGVGLSLARQVVLAHRGSIWVGESESGGALFRIIL